MEIREVDPADEAALHRWWQAGHEAMAGRPFDLRLKHLIYRSSYGVILSCSIPFDEHLLLLCIR